MIVYEKNVTSLLKAAALGNIFNQPICLQEEADNTLLQIMEEISVLHYSWNDIISMYRDQYNKDIRWITTSRANILRQYIYIALRNKKEMKYNVCIQAAMKAFTHSPEIILHNSCKEAKELNNYRKAVLKEVHLLQSFIRFTPLEDNTIIAEVESEHDSMDLLLIQLRNRYPTHRIILLKDKGAWIMEKDHIIKDVNNQLYQKWLEADDFHSYWQAYYKSQYIEARKNVKLAAKMLPKKYWNWLEEGKILMEEERNHNRVL